MRILVSEDDEDALGLYKAVFESRGHEVVVTRDGQECLKSYADGKYDAVILDYKMPLVDGSQVAKEILSKNPKQRIIIASSLAEEAFGETITELRGVLEFVPKPFEPDVIVEAVEGRINR